MGFKPIFEEERRFFEKHTNILLPENCWRNGSKIYLDYTQRDPYLTFRVIDGNIVISKDNRKHSFPPQKNIEQLVAERGGQVDEMFEVAVRDTVKKIGEHPNHFYIVGYSGGKDSDLVYHIWKVALSRIEKSSKKVADNLQWVINFANTSNDTSDTYKRIKALPEDRLRILNPDVGFYQWVTSVKNYMAPTVLMRNCCSTYKEGQIYKSYDLKRPTIQVLGVRKYESPKRSGYDFYMDGDYYEKVLGKNSLPSGWAIMAPAINFRDEDVWLYLMKHAIPFNRQYRLGFNRCGCLICPYQSAYTDMLIKEFYPNIWDRWINILSKGYEINHIKQNFKWTLQEYTNGMWKEGKSKERFIITRKATPERIQELADLKGISFNMASKYFNRSCVSCDKKLNATEIAMFYKLNGRYEDVINDSRPIMCKKCYCASNNISQKEYMKKVYEFVDSGCNLF